MFLGWLLIDTTDNGRDSERTVDRTVKCFGMSDLAFVVLIFCSFFLLGVEGSDFARGMEGLVWRTHRLISVAIYIVSYKLQYNLDVVMREEGNSKLLLFHAVFIPKSKN